MSSEDVIELGSSDEDTEPAPKKQKTIPNVMVQIPSKLPEVTIKSTNKNATKINPVSLAKGKIGKSVTVTKVPKSNVFANPYANKNQLNGRTLKVHHNLMNVTPQIKNVSVPITPSRPTFNPQFPMVMTKGVGKVQVNTSKKPGAVSLNPLNQVSMGKIANLTLKGNVLNMVGNPSKAVKNPAISNLPPGLTIVKKPTFTKITKPMPTPKIKKPAIVRMRAPAKMNANEVLTVDLDDDEPETSTSSGPQWYLRPEDESKPENTDNSEDPLESTKDTVPQKTPEKSPKQTSSKASPVAPEKESDLNPEQANNKEPDKTNFIEITIEDSPIKPILNKKGFKVGAELAITIDDSPVKGPADKTPPVSDDEQIENVKEPNSRKRLKYPKEVPENVIEIEIEPLQPEQQMKEQEKQTKDSEKQTKELEKQRMVPEKQTKVPEKQTKVPEKQTKVPEKQTKEPEKQTKEPEKQKKAPEKLKPPEITRITDEVIEIEESPNKPAEENQITTPKKNKPKQPVKMTEIDINPLDDKEKAEFHPSYQAFIELCFKLENSDDMKKIVEKKIKSYYRQVPKDYSESEMFVEMVLSKTGAMKAAPEKMYLFIKDVVDELDAQRKIAKKQAEEKKEEQEKFLYGEESEFDAKRQRQIRKLEKTLKKLHRAIQKLEEQEVDFDDEEDSVYLLTERYKERMVRVHAKLCQLTNTKMPSEPRIQIDARPGQPKGPAKRLEKWINKKVPIGTPLPFPDFHDVLRCVRDANQQDKLGWNEADIMEEARDLFMRCGKKLQRRRQENEWRLAASRVQAEIDPAENSEDLQKKLADNKRVAAKRETEVLNKYADRQNQLNLKAVEIGDKEADESPVDSDDEEQVDDGSLENKEKRKERLKRLLQEKSRKSTDKRDSQVSERSEDEDKKDSEEAGTSVENTESKKQDLDESVEEPPKKRAKIDEKDSTKKYNNKDKKNKDEDKNDKSSEENDKDDKVHSLSDDSNKVESDIDELHLLQKLHSENEVNSSTSESDSDSPIAISDESDSSNENDKASSDVISIENSSYSESEDRKEVAGLLVLEEIEEEDDSKALNEVPKEGNEMEPETISLDEVLLLSPNDASNEIPNATALETNPSDKTSIDDMLIEDSPDAQCGEINDIALDTETCVNLRDDNISIDETIIENNNSSPEDTHIEPNNTISLNTETCVNLRDDNISIDEAIIDDSVLDDGNKEVNKRPDETSLDTGTCTNLKDDTTSIHETAIEDNSNSPEDTHIEANNEISLNTETCVNLSDDNITIDEAITEDLQDDTNNKEDSIILDDTSLDTGTCINSKDDTISIHETAIEENRTTPEDAHTKDNNEITINTETCVNLRDDNVSIDEAIIENLPEDINNVICNENTLESVTSVNSKDDNVSIHETGIENSPEDANKETGNVVPIEFNFDDETCLNLNEDNILIQENVIDDIHNRESNDSNSKSDNNSVERMEIGTDENGTPEIDTCLNEEKTEESIKDLKVIEANVKKVEISKDAIGNLNGKDENITKEGGNAIDEKTDISNEDKIDNNTTELMEVDSSAL